VRGLKTLGAAIALAFAASSAMAQEQPAVPTTPGGSPATVSGPGGSVSGDIASFSGVGGTTIQDSGISSAGIAPPLPSTANDTQLYPLWPGITVVAGTVAPTQNTARCSPFILGVPEHWDELLIDIATLGTGPIAVALYTDAIDTNTGKHQPQSLESSSSLAFTVTAAGVSTVALGAAGTGIAVPAGMNWICTNDANSADAVRATIFPASSSLISAMMGSVSGQNILSLSQVNALTRTQTSGTWPSSFAGNTWSESATGATILTGYRVASAP
jgi:hypothetical protein